MVLTTCLSPLQERQTGEVAPNQNCLATHTSYPLFKSKPHSQDPKDGLRGVGHRVSLLPFPTWPHWVNLLSLPSLVTCLFNWPVGKDAPPSLLGLRPPALTPTLLVTFVLPAWLRCFKPLSAAVPGITPTEQKPVKRLRDEEMCLRKSQGWTTET